MSCEPKLPLRELEAFPSAGLPRFFALFHPRIAAKQAFSLQRSTKIRVDQKERARNCQTGSARLAGSPATSRVDRNIVGVRQFHHLQRLEDGVLERDGREIVLKALAVNIDLAVARRHAYARDGSFAAAGSDEF